MHLRSDYRYTLPLFNRGLNQDVLIEDARGELSYLTPLDSENISAPYFKQRFFRGGGVTPPRQSNATPPSPKTEITNILFYILNFASIIKFKM